MSIQAVIFDMYETLITQFCNPLYYGTEIARDLGLSPVEFLPGWRATELEAARAFGMQAVQATWYRQAAYEHKQAALRPDFPQLGNPMEVLDWLKGVSA